MKFWIKIFFVKSYSLENKMDGNLKTQKKTKRFVYYIRSDIICLET